MAMRKYLLLSILLLFFQNLIAQSVLEKTISLQTQNTPLFEILDTLSQQTKVQFTYDKSRIPSDKKFSLQAENISLKKALTLLFKDSNIEFKSNKNYLILYREDVPYYTISGYIRDAKNGETLIEANVFDTKYFRGCSSNEYGFYSLSLPEGKYIIKTRYIGYQESSDTIELYRDISQNILLHLGNELAEILVVGNSFSATKAIAVLDDTPTNGERIDVEKAQSLPTFMGERDVLKYLQLLPGVVFGGLAGNNLYIRGGSLDQNLIMLDDVPLYNVNHLFGLVSVFNGDIVHSAKTYLDGFPARYGGRLSSLIDIRTKDGNKQAIHGGASLGFSTATTYLEGPIQKDKSSFLLSARRTWLDIPLNQINVDPSFNFYDLNAKVNFKLSSKDRLYLGFYTGEDAFVQTEDKDSLNFVQEEYANVDWGNTAFSLRWNRILNKKLFLNTTLLQSSFHFNLDYFRALEKDKENVTDLRYKSQIQQSAIKTDFSYLPNNRHLMRFGSRYHFYQNNPGIIERNYLINAVPSSSETGTPKLLAHQITLYAEDEIQLNSSLTLHPGIRLVAYTTQGKTRWLPQLRFQLNYAASEKKHWGISYAEMAQFTHLLDNSSIESNNNKWVLATKNIRPAISKQVAVNFQSFFTAGWKLKIAGYYKKMQHLRRFQQGANILTSIDNWEESTVKGIGKVYGAEFLIGKMTGHTQGWLTYTYSKSQRKFDNFADKNYFSYQHDRRHTFNATITHQFKEKKRKERQISLVWVYASGNWLTVPRQVFESPNGLPLPNIDAVNNYQLPASHRLDLSYLRKKTTKRGFQHHWTFGVFNVYGQNNPYSAELQFTTPPNTFKLVSNNLAVTPIPYVTYGFKF